jgi:hypothetical protein
MHEDNMVANGLHASKYVSVNSSAEQHCHSSGSTTMASSTGKEGYLIVGMLITMSLLLSGCSFGTTDNNACDGGACACENSYYGMEAGMYFAGVPVEHASLHVTIPQAEPDTVNSTGCCQALYYLYPVREPGVNVPDALAQQQFCNSCAKAPNAEISEAAKSCPSLASAARSLSPHPATKLLSGKDNVPDSDAYADCPIEFDKVTITLINGKNVTGAKASFNIRWTDPKNSSTKSCCAAIWPIVHGLYFNAGNTTEPERQSFCKACKAAFNPGVGLAAYRWCPAAMPQHGETTHVSQIETITNSEPVLA